MEMYAYDAEDHGHGKLVRSVVRPNIHPLSKVFVSIAEFNPSNRTTFIGDARMTIHNVAPQDGSVLIWYEIEWDYDLQYILNILVVNL